MDKPIAILGWGSLLWELEVLAPHVRGLWQMRTGPELPMEFTRISLKRKRALVACIDLMQGVKCPTSVIASTRTQMVEARRDLARRERTPDGFIGGVCFSTGVTFGRPQVVYMVAQWCRDSQWGGAVWTDLYANYLQERGVHFSVDEGIDYLKSLEGESLDEAVRYITMAPSCTNTRLRRKLVEDPWWQAQAERVVGDRRPAFLSS